MMDTTLRSESHCDGRNNIVLQCSLGVVAVFEYSLVAFVELFVEIVVTEISLE